MPSPAEPADEDDPIAIIKAQIYLPDFVGGQRVCCPFHDPEGKRSASVQVYDQQFKCFAGDCGEYGDVFDWICEVEGVDLEEAIEIAAKWNGEHKCTSGQTQRERDARGQARALQLWKEGRPIAGTLGAKYLSEKRHVDLTQLPANIHEVLRFHAYCPFGKNENGSTRHVPAVLALFRDVLTDQPCTVHRIGLTRDGDKIHRQMLGRWPGERAVKLWTLTGPVLVIAEGIETALSAATVKRIKPAWALSSAGAIERFPIIPGVRCLYIHVDNYPVGQAAAMACARRWKAAGVKVISLPPTQFGFDANDVVRKQQAAHVSV